MKTSDILHPIPVTPKPWYMVGIDLIDAHKDTHKRQQVITTQKCLITNSGAHSSSEIHINESFITIHHVKSPFMSVCPSIV